MQLDLRDSYDHRGGIQMVLDMARPTEVQQPEAAAAWLSTAQPIIISGAPYSGASVLATALAGAGWYSGDCLHSLRPHDPAGSYQDEEVAGLHQGFLSRHGVELTDPTTFAQAASSGHFRPAIAELLDRKFRGRSVWGWKDSRATLLLDQWEGLVPGARWIFAVRDPALFAWSTLFRELLQPVSPYPLVQVRRALQIWTHYNDRILQFVRSQPERCLLVTLPGGLEAAQTTINDFLRKRCSYELPAIDLSTVYNPHLFKKKCPRWVAAMARAHGPSRRIFSQLRQLETSYGRQTGHSISVRRPDVPHQAKPVVCVAAKLIFKFSETFVHAHATRLPASVKMLQLLPLMTEDGLPLASRWQRVSRNTNERLSDWELVSRNTPLIARYLRRERVAAVLAEFGPVGCFVADACKQERVPLAIHFHGYDVFDRNILRQYRQRYHQIFEDAAAIIGVSLEMMEHLVALGAPADKLVYNPCGVDTEIFKGADPANVPPNFIAVGRFVPKKAPHLTLLAFARVLERVPEAKLTMIGGGELMEAVRLMVKAMGIDHAVELLGPRQHYEVAAAMRRSRAFIQHSAVLSDGNSEGTPVSVLEAGSCGLPVVATRHGGIPDVVLDGKTGLLIDELDIDGMADAMVTLAQDPALSSKLGEQAREHIIANYSMDISINRLWKVLEGIIAKPKA